MSVIEPSSAFRAAPESAVPMKFGDALRHRLSLLRGTQPDDAHTPPLRYFFAELLSFSEPLTRPFRDAPVIKEATTPCVVILLPGFATGPNRMRYMANQLERAGHTVKRWGMGHNLGVKADIIDNLSARVCDVHERYGQKVVLIGWSMGGVFAREVAKVVPEHVDKVISMGSPFSHSPYSNNFWRPYQVVAGHSVEAPPIDADTRTKPPVETVAFWSPRDGVISRRAASGLPHERDRALALRCSHLMFPNDAECIEALARELEAPGT
ncbi:esterase/lipase family protein [Aurantiacibacter sp. D1-12]|uniref:esterase/lipase family protein n=1 Tax=Aurantiacibacter sp. D1-12 TaxID=2993658 RepID=UPI00237D0D00|nr:alpha/beta fold hydrolase [Aurantiacibacter sp. D1-12]MDE1467818.1 alpha/beta fold hydrolase [Aurantiacibacter sp. D1-12]